MSPDRVDTSTRLNSEHVLSNTDYFIDVQLWPLSSELDPRGWLRNFNDDETEYALYLLNAFTYYSRRLVDELFVAAFHNLCVYVTKPDRGFVAARGAWEQFNQELLVTNVEGEHPNPTDSGFAFARRARQLLGVNEERILPPAQALDRLMSRGKLAPVLFVDDFVGSGQQFLTTWERIHRTNSGVDNSFAQISAVGGQFYYCPLLCTSRGQLLIRTKCPSVVLQPVHVLEPHRDSAVADNSHLWPEHLRATANHFLKTVSARAGIPEEGPKGYRGFADLGLTVAFEHSVPDATLPLFYWEANGWTPLIRRR